MKKTAEQLPLFPKRPYNQPGDPAEYTIKPVQLSSEDAIWMREIDKRIWKPCAPDRFSRVTYVDDGHITLQERDKIFELIRQCKLLTTMGCGMFGLSGYSMAVWVHPECPGLNPEVLVSLTDKHLPDPPPEVLARFDKGDEREATWENAWIFFSQFTHSPTNREMLELYQGSRFELPRGRSYYDY